MTSRAKRRKLEGADRTKIKDLTPIEFEDDLVYTEILYGRSSELTSRDSLDMIAFSCLPHQSSNGFLMEAHPGGNFHSHAPGHRDAVA